MADREKRDDDKMSGYSGETADRTDYSGQVVPHHMALKIESDLSDTPSNSTCAARIGIVAPKNRTELESLGNRLTNLRVVQFILSLVCFGSLGAHYRNSTSRSGQAMVAWELAIGILSFLFSMGNGVFGFLCSSEAGAEADIANWFAKTAIYGDLFFVFMTISAFTSGAGFTIECVDACTAAKLGTGVMFFVWISYLYSTPLSFFVFQNRHMYSIPVEP